tara:strand:+ start:4452 stop:4571 length:120 start_codon:yes stop_codon:yes gene_type:complete
VAGGIVGLFFGLWINQLAFGIVGGLLAGWLVGFITRKDI